MAVSATERIHHPSGTQHTLKVFLAIQQSDSGDGANCETCGIPCPAASSSHRRSAQQPALWRCACRHAAARKTHQSPGRDGRQPVVVMDAGLGSRPRQPKNPAALCARGGSPPPATIPRRPRLTCPNAPAADATRRSPSAALHWKRDGPPRTVPVTKFKRNLSENTEPVRRFMRSLCLLGPRAALLVHRAPPRLSCETLYAPPPRRPTLDRWPAGVRWPRFDLANHGRRKHGNQDGCPSGASGGSTRQATRQLGPPGQIRQSQARSPGTAAAVPSPIGCPDTPWWLTAGTSPRVDPRW